MSNIDMNKNSENASSNYTGDDKFVIKNLNLHYGDFHALKNINMNIPKNQITAFIGPSGCGKSTFLKTLNRMNDLIEGVKIDGEVYLDGANIFTEMDDITLRHRVGMVFQQPNPFPKSIYDNIAYGPRLFGVHKKAELDIIVEKALKQAAIWDEVKDRLKKSALGLSGGQQASSPPAPALISTTISLSSLGSLGRSNILSFFSNSSTFFLESASSSLAISKSSSSLSSLII